MHAPRSLTTSSPGRPPAPAATGIRAHLERDLEHLMQRIRRSLSKAGLGRAGDLEGQARDALQELAVEALKSEAKYDPSRDPRAWLHGIAMNVVRRHVERFATERRRWAPEPPADDDEAVEALHEQLQRAGSGRGSASAEEVLARRQEIEAALSVLSEAQREDLRLFYFEHDEDNEAVAAQLGITPGNARLRRFRALAAAGKRSPR
jgi:RNA polymerase sigma factor (sigma-70 family)